MSNFNKKQSYKRPIDKLIESKVGLLIVAALTIIMALVFILIPGNYKAITREEAIAYTGQLREYQSEENLCCLLFSDESRYYLYPHVQSSEFKDRMTALDKGTTLHILINPNTDDVLEIRTDTEELKNFDAEQAAIGAYVKGYVWLGVFFLLLAVFLFWFVFKRATSTKKEQELQEQQLAKRIDGFDNTAVRRADFSQKHRVLLEKKINDYEICYRRVKSVNELVINGFVYDERKAIVEFEHTLSASIDGHLIEAGLDSESYSFIAFDGNVIAQKKRLI